MSARARTSVEAYFSSINAERFPELIEVFAENVRIHVVGATPVAGREAAITHFVKLLAGYAEHDDCVTRWIEADDAGTGSVVTEIDFTGRLLDGRPIAFAALDVFDLRDGRIAKVTTWYDTREVRRQVLAS
ncbi:nuclear transport factor 2 family protein [Amycolatopsis sp. FDAARGOS 1241]|uniref:nuclear transport factor 2 family protein n=1 Tax=Amycolatopsis sp. FDAARGOS 1241 TaxID=2778070 RepID=UPI00194E06CB|nr:nuclear transport factor 2 family protein [Amycolatopsis sp. FDAARGOS 1241]QRP43106.1 nuclear transport factor 2 family protein [Amycolatopsis sp. FDAARGOS 1241]